MVFGISLTAQSNCNPANCKPKDCKIENCDPANCEPALCQQVCEKVCDTKTKTAGTTVNWIAPTNEVTNETGVYSCQPKRVNTNSCGKNQKAKVAKTKESNKEALVDSKSTI